MTGFLKVFIRMGFCSLCFGIELKIVLLLKENTSYFHVHAGKVKKGGGGVRGDLTLTGPVLSQT